MHSKQYLSLCEKRWNAKLEELATQDIIAKVSEPTDLISSMVVKIKKTGDIRICLDPKDLNKDLHRVNYPLPVIEDIATKWW